MQPSRASRCEEAGEKSDRPSLGGSRPLWRYHPLVLVLVPVCVGIVFDRYRPLSLRVWLVLSGAGLLSWGVLFWFRRRGVAWVALAVALAGLGAAWHHRHWHDVPPDHLVHLAGWNPQPMALRGRVLRVPEEPVPLPPSPLRPRAQESCRWEIEAEQVRIGRRWQGCSGRVRVISPSPGPALLPGDEVELLGQLGRYAPPANPGQWDHQAHARAQGVRIYLRVQYAEAVRLCRRGSGLSPRRLLALARQRAKGLLARYVASENTPLAAALLLGARRQVPHETTDAFFRTNTIHFLAISGLHVGMLAVVLLVLLRWGLLPRRVALVLVGLGTLAYTLLTGAPPSAVRATVLVLITAASYWLYRPQRPWNTLAAAALVVLALNPADLFRVGPQLSFLAVGTLGALAPWWNRWRQYDALERLIRQTRPWPVRAARHLGRWLGRGLLGASLLWLVSLPLVAHRFHLVAPVAVPLTVLLTVPVALALLGSLGVLLLGAWFPPGAALCGLVASWSLEGIQSAVHAAAQVPGTHWFVAGPRPVTVLAFYGLLAVWYLGLRLWGRRGLWLAMAAWAVVLLGDWLTPRLAPGRMHLAFLSLGHGLCTVIHLPDGRTVLYDCGAMGRPELAARTVAEYLWHSGRRRVDLVVISHADVDHFNALPQLARFVPVREVVVHRGCFDSADAATAFLQQELVRLGIPYREVVAGHTLLQDQQWRLHVLAPAWPLPEGKDNARSLVVELEYRGHRVLLPGDLEGRGLARLLALPARRCQGLLAPHHGSRNSNPPGLARWCRPRWVVISGPRPRPGEPPPAEAAYRAHGAVVLHTGRVGAVLAELAPEETRLRAYGLPDRTWSWPAAEGRNANRAAATPRRKAGEGTAYTVPRPGPPPRNPPAWFAADGATADRGVLSPGR